jgi:molecular chaperone GrpE
MIKTQSSQKRNEKSSPDADTLQPPVDDKTLENETVSDPVKELENRCEKAEQESRQNYERLLRVSADFENFKKRSFRETDDFGAAYSRG